MYFSLFVYSFPAPLKPSSPFSGAHTEYSKFGRIGMKLQWGLMGISILASILSLSGPENQIKEKLDKLLGHGPPPLNHPVQKLAHPPSQIQPIDSGIQASNNLGQAAASNLSH
eukprot:NODE_24_length_41419_cov_0.818780.p33 type:complete len:113 gc:universal NODE_24_length_41419_cov_0.818780:32071-32409(+)